MGGFFDRQAGEEAELDDPAELLVHLLLVQSAAEDAATGRTGVIVLIAVGVLLPVAFAILPLVRGFGYRLPLGIDAGSWLPAAAGTDT